MTEQRRLAAIISADVAGYSRLMGRDEGGTLAALKALRQEVVDPAIAMHGGRIVKTTGDGLLLEFPSVVNAVRCAIEVQTAMASKTVDIPVDRRIAFRLGINIGDIIVEGDDIFGDGVNVAARLQEIAPPGGICISSRVHEDVRDRLDTAFDDGGTQTLKNIARPVQVWSWQPGTAVALRSASAPTTLPLPDKPSIAVLPFLNMSGDAEQEYFADGMVEEIITSLSRNRGLFVTARNSSFTYKGRSVDIRQVGRDLGVRYVLEGSVRKASNKVRIAGQLIDAETGSHLWADRFDGGLEDVFELQDQVANKVAAVISPAVELAEIKRVSGKKTNLNAYDFYLQATALFRTGVRKDLDAALQLAEQCLALEPNFARCHALVALIYTVRVMNAFRGDPSADATAAERAAQQAMSLDPNDAFVLMQYGQVLVQVLARYGEGISLLDTAIELDPNLAAAWELRGVCNGGQGKIGEAITDFEHALRLNPRDPRRWVSQHGLAWVCLLAERYDEAISWATKVLQAQPQFGFTIRVMIAAHALAGRLDKAHEAMKTHMGLEEGARISTIRPSYLRRVTPQAFEVLANGLRKAGFPE